ncbi:MAG: type and secretion system protein [Verrucomicrobiales bacterium]|nr:type and secretion system protein [Verrucomicrobiales bacterium]
MAHSSSLEFRIRQLLGGKSAPQSPIRYAAVGIGTTFLAAVLIGCGTVQKNSGEADSTYLSGAHTPLTPIDSRELSALIGSPPSKAIKYKLNIRVIGQNGGTLAGPGLLNGKADDFRTFPPSITVRTGQKGTLEMIREFPHPTSFDLPQWPDADGSRKPAKRPEAGAALPNGGSYPVTPVTPRDFSFRNIGWKLDALTVKPQGAFLVVSGTFHETTFDGFIQNAGEAYSPIITSGTNAFGRKELVVLSDNKVLSPTFTSRETPFQAAALPGKTYRIRLNLKQPDAFLEVTCAPEE